MFKLHYCFTFRDSYLFVIAISHSEYSSSIRIRLREDRSVHVLYKAERTNHWLKQEILSQLTMPRTTISSLSVLGEVALAVCSWQKIWERRNEIVTNGYAF